MRSLSTRIQALERDRPEAGMLVAYPLPSGVYPAERYLLLGTDEEITQTQLEKLSADREVWIWDIPTPAPEILAHL